jgi:hypothetical protein
MPVIHARKIHGLLINRPGDYYVTNSCNFDVIETGGKLKIMQSNEIM